MGDLLTQLAATGGPVGIALALSYLFIRQQNTELRDVENKRVEDNKAMVSKLLELNDKWVEALNAQAELIESQRQTLTDLRQMMFDDIRGSTKGLLKR